MPLPTSSPVITANPGLIAGQNAPGLANVASGIPAFDRLMAAFKQGVVDTNDLIDMGLFKGRERQLKSLELEKKKNDILGGEEIRPLEQQAKKNALDFEVRNLPARQEALDLQIKSARRADSAATQAEAVLPKKLELERLNLDDQLAAAKLLKADPSGAQAHAIQMYLQGTGASSLPRVTDPERTDAGEIDWSSIDTQNSGYLKRQESFLRAKDLSARIKSVEGTSTTATGGKQKAITTYMETETGPQQVGKPLVISTESPVLSEEQKALYEDLRKLGKNSEALDDTGVLRPAAKLKEILNTAIASPGGTAKLTDVQSNAMQFADRMNYARMTFEGLESRGFKAASAGTYASGKLPNFLNFLRSGEQQSYLGAKKNWISAALRKESGAAILKSEEFAADAQYFPLPADVPEEVNRKAELRRIAEQNMRRAAGPGAEMVPPREGAAGSTAAVTAPPQVFRDASGNYAVKNPDGSFTPVRKNAAGQWEPL